MQTKKYEWLEKKFLRSTDNLRLWNENPRLDFEEKPLRISEYINDLISDNSEKESFFKLVDSISEDGFIPADPIVVWQGENNKYYVAEGNRRVLALKILRNPEKAPKHIRAFVRKKAKYVNRDEIEKIKVCIAPSFDETEWYINQRHSMESLTRPWSRLQQQRWIERLYDKYGRDVSKIMEITKRTKSSLETTLRILHIRDLAIKALEFGDFTEDEKKKVTSHRIPITIFERWFFNAEIKEKWGLVYKEDGYEIISNKRSFLKAYAHWLKLVIHRNEPDVGIRINTRTISDSFDQIMGHMPEVSFDKSKDIDIDLDRSISGEKDGHTEQEVKNGDKKDSNNQTTNNTNLQNNPDRNRLIIDNMYVLQTTNYKLNALFSELEKLPLGRYNMSIAIIMRVFVDIAVSEFIKSEGQESGILENNKSLEMIQLKKRISYLKHNKFSLPVGTEKVIDQLLNRKNEFSLDTLNNYVHGSSVHHIEKSFLNRFWDFLFPLLKTILDIKEK
ncbi:MAG: ParB/RepB/Spo0J family partition protein [Thermotogota bacterium]